MYEIKSIKKFKTLNQRLRRRDQVFKERFRFDLH